MDGRRVVVSVRVRRVVCPVLGCPRQSLDLLYRYIAQGRAEGDKTVTTSQRFARLLLARPGNLRDRGTALLRELTEACPEMTRSTGAPALPSRASRHSGARYRGSSAEMPSLVVSGRLR